MADTPYALVYFPSHLAASVVRISALTTQHHTMIIVGVLYLRLGVVRTMLFVEWT